MSIHEELTGLAELHRSGVLSDEEFSRAKARVLDAQPALDRPAPRDVIATLRRSRHGHWIGGVCGGLSTATRVDPWLWRLLFVLLALFGGAGVVLYVLMWVLVPLEDEQHDSPTPFHAAH